MPASSYEHAQRLVTLPGGRRLNLFCMGSGEPVVLLEAGGGEDGLTFRRVQGRLATTTRVCSYDRAGFGFSDPSDAPNTADHVVDDLHALIGLAGLPRPLVFVGHSNGGLYGRLYASRFPDDIAGMVMIDPNSLGLNMAAEKMLDATQLKVWRDSDQEDVREVRHCVELAERGELSRAGHRHSECMDDPPNADPALHRLLDAQLATPSQQRALLSETVDTFPAPDGGLSNAELAVQRVPFDFKDKPFIVISGTNEQGGLPVDQRRKVIKAMLANEADLAAHSTRGKQVLADVHSEDIQLTHPRTVVRAVTEVVRQVRHDRHTPGT